MRTTVYGAGGVAGYFGGPALRPGRAAVRPSELPSGRIAVTLHPGRHDQMESAYLGGQDGAVKR